MRSTVCIRHCLRWLPTLTPDRRRYIDVIQDLVAAGLEKVPGFALPRLAVVGEQSTGKTSLLESIVGSDLLPKAEELATRRPLFLKLKNDPACTTPILQVGNSELAIEMVDTAELLKARVQSLTDEVAGSNGGIIAVPIYLHITAATCPDLTLVDLPGIAKNPLVNSDQGEDIEEVTKSLIESFIKSEETVILAVVPANMDAAASDALKLARKFDPDMKREALGLGLGLGLGSGSGLGLGLGLGLGSGSGLGLGLVLGLGLGFGLGFGFGLGLGSNLRMKTRASGLSP